LNGKSTNEIQEMIFQKMGINWNNFESKYKRGRSIIKNEDWKVIDVPIFTQERDFLNNIITLNT
jgi:tRNA(His) 5'-end guanylyltransferase